VAMVPVVSLARIRVWRSGVRGKGGCRVIWGLRHNLNRRRQSWVGVLVGLAA